MCHSLDPLVLTYSICTHLIKPHIQCSAVMQSKFIKVVPQFATSNQLQQANCELAGITIRWVPDAMQQ